MKNHDVFSSKTMICPECGREFEIPSYSDWKYKTCLTSKGMKNFCSYTCYDHAMIRKEGRKIYITKEKFKEVVDRSERSMVGQGKTIIDPIKVV